MDKYRHQHVLKVVSIVAGWRVAIRIQNAEGQVDVDQHTYPIAALALVKEWQCVHDYCTPDKNPCHHYNGHQSWQPVWAAGHAYLGDAFQCTQERDEDIIAILGPSEIFDREALRKKLRK